MARVLKAADIFIDLFEGDHDVDCAIDLAAEIAGGPDGPRYEVLMSFGGSQAADDFAVESLLEAASRANYVRRPRSCNGIVDSQGRIEVGNDALNPVRERKGSPLLAAEAAIAMAARGRIKLTIVVVVFEAEHRAY